MSAERCRDRGFERETTNRAATGLGIDVEALNRLAEARADGLGHEAYGRDFPDIGRDLRREAIEELLDARNYVVWLLDAMQRGWILAVNEDRTRHLQAALRHVILAFEEINRSRE